MKIVISSGHGKYVRGASGYIDEVDEARKVVEKAAGFLRRGGVETTTFHDDVSRTQSENLSRIVDFHNSQTRDLDISVHFNANETTSEPMGTEVLYVTQEDLAAEVSEAICDVSGLKNRGAKYRGDLAFLNGTEEPAILIETCFVDSQADVDIYHENFDVICDAIAGAVAGEEAKPGALFTAKGTCSHFGGPEDTGVSPDEGLAFIYELDDVPYLFLPYQPNGTTGLARRLNPFVPYIACRWDYDVTSKEMLRGPQVALVRSLKSGYAMKAFPADWGPHEDTGRVADLSPGLMSQLDLTTDDEVEVIYPYEEV